MKLQLHLFSEGEGEPRWRKSLYLARGVYPDDAPLSAVPTDAGSLNKPSSVYKKTDQPMGLENLVPSETIPGKSPLTPVVCYANSHFAGFSWILTVYWNLRRT